MWNKISRLLIVMSAVCLGHGGMWYASEAMASEAAKLDVSSSAFQEGATIPKLYTCDGNNTSPPLKWGFVPERTQSIAVICDDPDAPGGTFVHWVLFNLPPETQGLPENVPAGRTLANGAKQGNGTSKKTGYFGPCPPSGVHRYFFKVYALDSKINLDSGITKNQLLNAMEGHVLAEGRLIGTYKRR
jgi:Raf kinase inhibitor-like YbhB/YbcL family protein